MSAENQHRLALTEFLALLVKKHSFASKRFLDLYKERRERSPRATVIDLARLDEKIRYWEVEAHTCGGLVGALNSCIRSADGGFMKEHWSPDLKGDPLAILTAECDRLRQELTKRGDSL